MRPDIDPFLRYQIARNEAYRRMKETEAARNWFLAACTVAAIVYAILNAPQ